jgi:hypothetical protein
MIRRFTVLGSIIDFTMKVLHDMGPNECPDWNIGLFVCFENEFIFGFQWKAWGQFHRSQVKSIIPSFQVSHYLSLGVPSFAVPNF